MNNAEQEMLTLEEALLHTAHAHNPEQLDGMLAADFTEVAANGQRTSREAVLQWLLKKDPQARWHLQHLQVKELGPVYRWVHYHAKQTAPVPSTGQGSWHSSLWSRQDSNAPWQLTFHQATKLQ